MHRIIICVLGLFVGVVATAVGAAPSTVQLPADKSKLRVSKLPGYALAQQKCGICHSADYVSFQPPGMTLAQWTAEMTKMQHSYGAPITDEEVKVIGAYLAVAYGSAKATDPEVVAASALAKPAATATTSAGAAGAAIDVQALLNANACLGCHAVDRKVVGPSFHDVATKYKSDAAAQDKLAASIRSGGSGKWGPVAMPASTGLSDAQAKAIAAYVLKQ